jgi:hypothetical protein
LYRPPLREAAINGYQTLVGTSEGIHEVQEAIRSYLIEAVQQQGIRALGCPRTAAIAHEAGHTVVCSAFGEKVRGTQIWCVRGDDYSGETRWGSGWDVGLTSTPDRDFRIGCCLLSGVLGEIIFDGAHFRFGSSADEVIQVQLIASQLAPKLGCTSEEAMMRILASTSSALIQNEQVVRSIGNELHEHESIGEPKLELLLLRVTKRAWALDLAGWFGMLPKKGSKLWQPGLYDDKKKTTQR